MPNYLNLDDTLLEIPVQHTARQKPNIGVHSTILAAALAGGLFLGYAALPAAADGTDTSGNNGTEQVGQEIDLSQYIKVDVSGTQGIEVYVSPVRKNFKNWDNLTEGVQLYYGLYKKESLFWDLVIRNFSNHDITINRIETLRLTGPKNQAPEFIDGDTLLLFYGRFSDDPKKLHVKPQSMLKIEDIFYVNPLAKNDLLQYTFSGLNENGNPCQCSFKVLIDYSSLQ